MSRKLLLHGLLTGLLGSVAAFIYNSVYIFATGTDFSRVVNTGSMLGYNFLAGMLAVGGYWLLVTWLAKRGEIIFNFLYSILSFALIIIPISMALPLDVRNPELFPGLAVPMIFFPVVSWYTVQPIFRVPPFNNRGSGPLKD